MVWGRAWAIRRLDRIHRRRRDLLGQVAELPADVLTARPAPGKWSILEIIEHLVLAEEDVMGDLARLEDLPASTQRLKHRVSYLAVLAVLRLGIPVKAPSAAMVPTGTRSLGELREAWDRNHHHLNAFVGGLDRRGASRAIFRHPVTGPLTVAQGIRMLGIHLDAHIRQISRLVRAHRGLTSNDVRAPTDARPLTGHD